MAAAARIRAFFQVWKRQMRGVCVGGPTVAAIPASNSLHSVKFSSTAVSNSSSFLHCHGITAPAFLRVWQQQLLVHHLHREEEDAAYNNKSACSMHPRSGRRGISEQQELLGFESSNKSLFWNPWRPKQVRHIMVEVVNDDLERAIRKLMRRLRDDGCIRRLRSRQYYQKPSELKVLARKERDKRIQRKAFRKKLNWSVAREGFKACHLKSWRTPKGSMWNVLTGDRLLPVGTKGFKAYNLEVLENT